MLTTLYSHHLADDPAIRDVVQPGPLRQTVCIAAGV